MYVETYETSSKWTLFFNMRFIAMFITAICVLFLIKLRWPKKKSIYCIRFQCLYVAYNKIQDNKAWGKWLENSTYLLVWNASRNPRTWRLALVTWPLAIRRVR